MKNDIAIVNLNPGVDRILYLDKPFVPGGHNRSVRAVVCQGSKGANQAIMLHNLGAPTDYFTFTGGVYGEYCENLLGEYENIVQHLTPTACGVRLNIKVIDSDGLGTELNESGGPVTSDELNMLLSGLYAEKHSIVSLCGSFPQGVENDIYYNVILNSSSAGAKVILDAAGVGLAEGIKASPYLIKPNRYELTMLKTLVGFSAETVENSDEAALICGKIHDKYGCRVICTLDSDGSVYVGPDGVYRVTVAPRELKGFSGAGDSYLAAFIYASLVESRDTAEALKFAAAASCAKIGLDGTLMPTRDETIAALDAITVVRL